MSKNDPRQINHFNISFNILFIYINLTFVLFLTKMAFLKQSFPGIWLQTIEKMAATRVIRFLWSYIFNSTGSPSGTINFSKVECVSPDRKSRWSSSLYCPMWNSDQMNIGTYGMSHTPLYVNVSDLRLWKALFLIFCHGFDWHQHFITSFGVRTKGTVPNGESDVGDIVMLVT